LPIKTRQHLERRLEARGCVDARIRPSHFRWAIVPANGTASNWMKRDLDVVTFLAARTTVVDRLMCKWGSQPESTMGRAGNKAFWYIPLQVDCPDVFWPPAKKQLHKDCTTRRKWWSILYRIVHRAYLLSHEVYRTRMANGPSVVIRRAQQHRSALVGAVSLGDGGPRTNFLRPEPPGLVPWPGPPIQSRHPA